MSELAITQVKSGLGSPRKVRRTLEALGLRHQRTVVKPDNPAIRGMVFHVRHLVDVAPAGSEGSTARRTRRSVPKRAAKKKTSSARSSKR